MKSNILIYTEETFLFTDVLSAEFDVSIVKSKEEMLQLLNKRSFQLLIMSAKYILGGKCYGYKNLREHQIFYDIPVIAYTKENDSDLLTKLYSLSIKGAIDYSISKENLLLSVHEILNRSNPYIGTLRDRLIKVFIKYEDASHIVSNMLYLTNYLIWHYKLDREMAADIRISVIFLAIAIKNNKFFKVTTLVHDMLISPYVERIMKDYKNPISIDEHIILASLVFENIDSENKYKINAAVIDSDIATLAKEAILKSKIFISCSHDIYNFWERLDDVFNSYPNLSVENYHLYLHHIFKILYRALVKYGILHAEFDNTHDKDFNITIMPKGCTDEMMQQFIRELDVKNENIKFEKVEVNAQIGLMIQLNKAPDQTREPIKTEKLVDISKINSMHYKAETKISADDFISEFDADVYLLEDLAENEREAKNFLYFSESLTQEMIEAVSITLNRYTQLLNATVEFEDLAYSIGALRNVLSNMILLSLNEETKQTLKLYITGIIDDLSSWREHIFVVQDTPDIHYLDASLLDNCSEIEALINPDFEEVLNEDEGLDFF